MDASKKPGIIAGMEALRKSNAINQNISLKDLMDLGSQIEEAGGFGDDETGYVWSFIGEHFIFFGGGPDPAPKK